MHISAGDGARSGPRERVRCVAFAFIDLRPLAAVLQIHLLRYSRTPTRYKSIRDFSYETNSKRGEIFVQRYYFIQVETVLQVVPCSIISGSQNCLDFYHRNVITRTFAYSISFLVNIKRIIIGEKVNFSKLYVS